MLFNLKEAEPKMESGNQTEPWLADLWKKQTHLDINGLVKMDMFAVWPNGITIHLLTWMEMKVKWPLPRP